jgi:hypothetical protein
MPRIRTVFIFSGFAQYQYFPVMFYKTLRGYEQSGVITCLHIGILAYLENIFVKTPIFRKL